MKPPGGNTPRVKKMASEAGVSSPAATGGAGTVFEQHVNAYWLAHLLVGAIPPILRDSTVFEVYLQTEHLGWNTDDFLVVCVTGSETAANFLAKSSGPSLSALPIQSARQQSRISGKTSKAPNGFRPAAIGSPW